MTEKNHPYVETLRPEQIVQAMITLLAHRMDQGKNGAWNFCVESGQEPGLEVNSHGLEMPIPRFVDADPYSQETWPVAAAYLAHTSSDGEMFVVPWEWVERTIQEQPATYISGPVDEKAELQRIRREKRLKNKKPSGPGRYSGRGKGGDAA